MDQETLNQNPKVEIDWSLYQKLKYLGIIVCDNVRSHNVGTSNYSKHVIQPWSVWLDYPELTSWDHDIIKRILRTKAGDTRVLDYEKIIHICEERIRQIKVENEIHNIH
jgi:hypothetical protein